MNLELIKKLSEKYNGGLKKLSADIGMSEQNLHRCIRYNKIQAADLETIAMMLNVDIRVFFDSKFMEYGNNTTTNITKINDSGNRELVELCKSLVANFQQRDDVMNKLVSMVRGMESKYNIKN